MNQITRVAREAFTSDEEVLSLAEELTRIYKEYDYLSFSSDKNYGLERYRNLISKTSKIMEKIKKVVKEKVYTDYIRMNISPPNNVLELPGAGFLTKMRGKERSTTDYLLVWYEASTRTEYYFTGEDYIIKHDGKIDLPDEIMRFIRKKCQLMRNKNHGK